MKLVYMGTPDFAVPPLRALAAAGHDVLGVVTRIDKPAGRGRSVTAPPVKIAALGLGLKVYQPRKVRDPEFIEILRAIGPDVIVVAAYGQILPKDLLALPKFGCINIHASLLPKYRGAAPINWAIIRGEQVTGNTIMLMDEGMDTGPALVRESIPIDSGDTAGTLTKKLSDAGAALIVSALPRIATKEIVPVAQDAAGATLAPLLKKSDGLIDWGMPAREIHNRIRGLSPWPGAFGYLDGKMLKIIGSEVVEGRGEPGTLYEMGKDTLEAGTADGMLRIVYVQFEGKKAMMAGDFKRGYRTLAGKSITNS